MHSIKVSKKQACTKERNVIEEKQVFFYLFYGWYFLKDICFIFLKMRVFERDSGTRKIRILEQGSKISLFSILLHD